LFYLIVIFVLLDRCSEQVLSCCLRRAYPSLPPSRRSGPFLASRGAESARNGRLPQPRLFRCLGGFSGRAESRAGGALEAPRQPSPAAGRRGQSGRWRSKLTTPMLSPKDCVAYAFMIRSAIFCASRLANATEPQCLSSAFAKNHNGTAA
jgi:hypothetical protein